MNIVVGGTGFVGSTLARGIEFGASFSSGNIGEFKHVPDGCDLYLCCPTAQKWLVDKNPVGDLLSAMSIVETLRSRRFRAVYLFSTIDVYCESPVGSDEDVVPTFRRIGYGHNRRAFEMACMGSLECQRFMSFRLPALFGAGLKKNVIYDIMNGHRLEHLNSNSSYQWYDMGDLLGDVRKCEQIHQGGVFNLFNEPVETSELCLKVFGKEFGASGGRIFYDHRTKFCRGGYMRSREEVLEKLRRFVSEHSSK